MTTKNQDPLHGSKFEARVSADGAEWRVDCAYLTPSGMRFVQTARFGLTELEARALAALLNGAPAMLEALERVKRLARGGESNPGMYLTKTEAAIAQAVGESK